MTITKYRTGYMFDPKPIVKVECMRETDNSVFIDGGEFGMTHHAKNCQSFQYHDSYGEARAHLLQSGMRAVANAKKALQAAHDALNGVFKIPEVEP